LHPALAAPQFGEPEEEALIAGESIHGRRRNAVQRSVIGGECQLQSADVGNIFAQSQASIHVRARRGCDQS